MPRGMRVLLIEDNDMDALAVSEALDASPEPVILLREGTLAGGVASAARGFDVALLDLGLPDSAGLATIREFRRDVPTIPVVVLTGASNERAGSEALREGAQDYLVKGRDDALVLRATRYAIERHRAQARLEDVARRAERQDRIAALGTLVAGVAHEINNPLTYVKGNVELSVANLKEAARSPTLDAEAARHVAHALHLQESVFEGIARITSLTRSLRQLSRAPSGGRTPVDLSKIAAAVQELVASQGSNVEFETSFQEAPIVASEGEITQVVLNLILNAIQVMGASGRVRIATRVEGGLALLEVADEGPGIPEPVRARIFTPFFTTKTEGIGLGLSLSRKIAEDHGGTLAFADRPGGGTVFTLALPAVASLP